MARTSLAVHWLRLDTSTEDGTGSTPGQGTKIPHAMWSGWNIKTYVYLVEKTMDRGSWQATVHGVARVGHDLAAKPLPPPHLVTPVLVVMIHLCCCSVTKLCPPVCDAMDCSMPGFPVLHYLLEFAQIHVH